MGLGVRRHYRSLAGLGMARFFVPSDRAGLPIGEPR
jgi:hypothetical protein